MVKTYIIAEAGVNHDGQVGRALELIDIAVAAGADAVKFQMFAPALLVTQTAAKAEYQSKNLGDKEISQLEMLKALTLPDEAFPQLAAYCREKGIDFLCTPFDAQSLAYLTSATSMKYLKLSSGEVTNGVLLIAAARTGLPVILSTGMCDLEEIGQALAFLHYGMTHPQGYPAQLPPSADAQMLAQLQGKVWLLHCVSQYPAPFEATNLRAMDSMGDAFGLPVGLSDHTQGIAVPVAAVARGATVIEKHFTYDRNAKGPDHMASLSPQELAQMITAIRQVEQAMGSPVKGCQKIEENTRDLARKSLVAGQPIRKGELFSEENLACKRPAKGGLSPNFMFALLGKPAKADYAFDDFITAAELDT